jgi:hypothetical protein
MPTPKKAPAVDPFADIAEPNNANPSAANDPFADIAEPAQTPSPFAAGKDNKEGVYQMQTPDGQVIGVPYSKVMEATKFNYKISPDDRLRYGKDKIYQMRGIGAKFNPNTDIPQDTFTPQEEATKPAGAITTEESEHARQLKPGKVPRWTDTVHGALNFLPTAGAIAGGMAAGGLGLETGPGAVVTGTAGATAGAGAAEALRQELQEKIFPLDPRLTPKETAKGIAIQAGMGGASEIAGRGMSNYVFRPAIQALSRTAEASEKAGFRMLPSEVAGTKPSVFETYPKASIFSSGSMANWRELQNQETEKAAKDLADQISKKSLSATGSREEAGDFIRDGIEAHMDRFRQTQNAMYAAIDKRAAGLTPSRTDMVAFAKQELARLNAAEKAGGKTLMSPFRERLESIVKNPLKVAPFNAMKDLRSSLLSDIRDDNSLMSGTEKGFLKKMAGIVDQSIYDELKKSGIKGLPQLWRNANAITREEHEIFAQKLIDNLAAKKHPEDIALVLRGNSPGAIAPLGIQETRDAMKIIPKSMVPQVQKQILLDTMYESTKKGTEHFNEKEFAKKILQIGDERGEVLFDTNWQKVKEFSELLNKISESGGLQAASLSNPEVLKQVGRLPIEMALSVAGFHGSLGATVGAVAFPVVTEAALWKTVAAALIHPQGAANLLKGLRILAKTVPYASTAGINEFGGLQKGLDRVKAEAQKLQQKTAAPTPTSTQPAPAPVPDIPQTDEDGNPVGPQSNAKPSWTHIYDPFSGRIVPA